MNRFDTRGLSAAEGQCFVCETLIVGDNWFAQLKHEGWTIRLCCPRCAKSFYKQRVPSLRRIQLLAALPSFQWPRQQSALLSAIRG